MRIRRTQVVIRETKVLGIAILRTHEQRIIAEHDILDISGSDTGATLLPATPMEKIEKKEGDA